MADRGVAESDSSTMASSAAGFCYSDVSAANTGAAHLVSQIHGGYDPNQSEIFASTNMDMIGFSKNNNNNSNLMFVDDSTLRCVFPCEGNERPSQGLSLSLSSTDPSSIGLQSFELRHPSSSQTQFQLRSSKFLGPAQDLLNEFCSLGTKQHQQITDQTWTRKKTGKSSSSRQFEDDSNNDNGSSSSSKPLNSLEFLELQKRKTKLLSLLEEVDRRYRHYCDQMKAVVASFESMAGNGSATVYSALASKAMSRHFRCLRDGIVDQIQATKKAMGEKDPVAPGTTRGETPRLKVIDQTLRQQRAFQQMNMMESHPWRPQRGLPERSVSILRAWLFEHFLHPYPSDVDKHILARQTGLSRGQVSNWFINARVRLWKPMVEEMYMEETKEHETSDGLSDPTADNESHQIQNLQSLSRGDQDQKPSTDQLVRIDSECLSSIITSQQDKNTNHSKGTTNSTQEHPNPSFLGHHGFGQVRDSFAAMELDFSSYHHHHSSGSLPYHENLNHFNGGGSSAVSLTLGLQHHNSGSGVSLAYPTASQSSLFYPRDHIQDCQTVQYPLLDGDQGQNLPYRNLMGAQLLHDLAG